MKSTVLLFLLIHFALPRETSAQDPQNLAGEAIHKHSVEIFPLVAVAGIYSVQYAYSFKPTDQLIAGFTYLNIIIEDKDGTEIGQFFAPTVPVGYRRYLWKNLHAEYQFWPAYNRYYEKSEETFYSGFDLYNEFRAGYTVPFNLGSIPLTFTPQYVLGFGLYPGNKPESFLQRSRETPVFHAPTAAVGIRF